MSLQAYLAGLREKPDHVRKQIAFGAAVGGTALVALVWAVSSVSLGTYALKSGGTEGTAPTSATNYGLAGAAGAFGSAQTPAHIEVVNEAAATATGPQAEQTVIPF